MVFKQFTLGKGTEISEFAGTLREERKIGPSKVLQTMEVWGHAPPKIFSNLGLRNAISCVSGRTF